MLRVLYSADYELYLGENLLPEREVLVEPTRALLDACDALAVPLTLFCDVACLWRYRGEGDEEFPAAAEDQLREAIRRGHDVQAHLHPHWLFAKRDGSRWTAPAERFLLGRLPEPRRDAAALLDRASTYLTTLLRPVDPHYACVAFRAGNYGLQPNEVAIFEALVETGYRVDSSVVPGLRLVNAVNRIDFRGWPARSGPLRGLHEVPIPSARFGPIEAVRRRLRQPPRRQPRGTTIQRQTGARAPLLRRLFRLDWLELGPDSRRLRAITERYLRRVGTDGVAFSVSAHPKAVGSAELEALAAYHRWLTDAYEVETLTFRRLAAAGELATQSTL